MYRGMPTQQCCVRTPPTTLTAVVLAIREQVLEQLSTRMPPEPRILDRLLAMNSSEQRVVALETVAAGGGVLEGAL